MSEGILEGRYSRMLCIRVPLFLSLAIIMLVPVKVLCQAQTADSENATALPAETVSEDQQQTSASAPAGIYDLNYTSLYTDHKARCLGDIVTVIVIESSKAAKSAATQSSKKSGSDGALSDLFGLGGLPLKMGVDAGSDYAGSGSTTRSGTMEATVSAVVKEILPNGNLVLEGSRRVTVNDDVQIITVKGVVRPQAIRSDNSVLSTYMADAQIEYIGEGPTAQSPGLVTRIIQTPFHWIASIFRKII